MKMCCLLQEVHRACYAKFSGATVLCPLENISMFCHSNFLYLINVQFRTIIFHQDTWNISSILRMFWRVRANFFAITDLWHSYFTTVRPSAPKIDLIILFHTAKNHCPATRITATVTPERSLFGIPFRTSLRKASTGGRIIL